MDTVHWLRERCEGRWCMNKVTRLELRRTVLGDFWYGWCDLHNDTDEYGQSRLLAVELIVTERAA